MIKRYSSKIGLLGSFHNLYPINGKNATQKQNSEEN